MLSVVSVVIAGALPVAAQDLDLFNLANELGMILASADHCGFAFEREAVDAYVAARVPPDAVGFASDLHGAVTVANLTLPSQSDTVKAAHCAVVGQTARHFGFME